MAENELRHRDKISTSALAKVLDVPSQQLFSTFKDYGWIRKLEEGWALTGKGEFEGGEYVHSKRFGRYIVWPESLSRHPLLQALEDNRHSSATILGKHFGLTAREVNRVLAEMGWIHHGLQGWELTSSGEARGGIQLENENSGTFYIVWPQGLKDEPLLSSQLKLCATIMRGQSSGSDDLFAQQSEFEGLDGHQHGDGAHLQICHWLYMAGICHACQRRLPVEDNLYADFYLPAQHVYIDYWGQGDGQALSQRMKRKDAYKQLGCTVIDIDDDDLSHLDEVLTRQLRKHGVRVY